MRITRLLAVVATALTMLAGATAVPAAGAVPDGHRRIQVVNRLKGTIWVAATPDAAHPMKRTGWVLKRGKKIDIDVPDKWVGRIWGRTGCTFDKKGRGHCKTGDCAGRFQCKGAGAAPATLAEFALGAWSGLDFYDVSMVDGASLPMYINIGNTKTKDPVSARGVYKGHPTKLVKCPKKMKVKGFACTTACAAFGGDAYCCEGAWAGRENCKPWKWPVDYTKVFERAEPYAYSYAFDDSATMSCEGRCTYRITFGVT